MSFLSKLQRREILPRVIFENNNIGDSAKKRIDYEFHQLSKSISDLSRAIEKENWVDIEHAVTYLLNRLIDSNSESVYNISPARKQERETFVALGGLRLLLSFLEPPLTNKDARMIPSSLMQHRGELWNEILVLLREICYSVPNLADHAFSDQHLSFLFTLLGHPGVFENTMNLLEEVLAVKVDTFDLSIVPRLFSLVGAFSTRQLMHFCRVLAVVLFESEDRQILECAHALRSLDLLQLRRDRMAKSSNIVERNQCLVMQMPKMLEKLTILLKIVNNGPELSKLVRHNIVAQTPSEVFKYIPMSDGSTTEWDFYRNLHMTVANGPSSSSSPTAAQQSEDDDVQDRLLTAFSPALDVSSMMTSMLNIMSVAEQLGLAHVVPGEITALGLPVLRIRHRTSYSYRQSKDYLMFQAMLLVPHQVELLFVMCTLLSGRRKIDVQTRLANLGMVDCLHKMFYRLSWGAEPFRDTNPIEHIHGPGCECNPESAVRVQFLRLVHNFYDRDFVLNPNKDLLLSSQEIQWIKEQPVSLLSKNTIPLNRRGLLSHIIATLINEPSESIYRFWLSSCLEAFLRGSHKDHQVFVAHSGVVAHLVEHVISIGVKSSTNLQTAFDLLGELIKFNIHPLDIMERCFRCQQQFSDFMNVVINNVVDSNVFLRSLYLSLDVISQEHIDEKGNLFTVIPDACYLTHSWVQCNPNVVSQRAIDCITRNTLSSAEARDEIVADAFKGLHMAAIELEKRRRQPAVTQPTTPETPSVKSHHPSQVVSCSPTSSPGIFSSGVNLETSSPRKKLSSNGWVLPDSLFRISLFLSTERENILLRLMGAVTIQSINHENICCLNTSLVVFILAHGRGNMDTLLDNTKRLARNMNSNGESDDDNDLPVCINFRKLLWYWKEYYLRRGRDRLSLEFSSHLPFSRWNEVVELLCSDNGSSMALLQTPIKLPVSPYRYLPRPPTSTSEFTHNYTKPFHHSAYWDA